MNDLETYLNEKGLKYSNIPKPIAKEIELYICILKEKKDQDYCNLMEAIEKGEVTYL